MSDMRVANTPRPMHPVYRPQPGATNFTNHIERASFRDGNGANRSPSNGLRAYPNNLSQEDKNLILDASQFVLDIGGIVDPTGIADLTNAGISLGRGNVLDAVISICGVLPIAGDAAKLIKMPRYTQLLARISQRVVDSPALRAAALPVLSRVRNALAGNAGMLERAGLHGINQIINRIDVARVMNDYGLPSIALGDRHTISGMLKSRKLASTNTVFMNADVARIARSDMDAIRQGYGTVDFSRHTITVGPNKYGYHPDADNISKNLFPLAGNPGTLTMNKRQLSALQTVAQMMRSPNMPADRVHNLLMKDYPDVANDVVQIARQLGIMR